jgi:hypothetical protein
LLNGHSGQMETARWLPMTASKHTTTTTTTTYQLYNYSLCQTNMFRPLRSKHISTGSNKSNQTPMNSYLRAC